MKKRDRKLALHRETVQRLDEAGLGRIEGGLVTNTTCNVTCGNTCFCPTRDIRC